MIPFGIILFGALVFHRIGKVKSRYVLPSEDNPDTEDVISIIEVDLYGKKEITRVDIVPKDRDYINPYVGEDYPLIIKIEEDKDGNEIITTKKDW